MHGKLGWCLWKWKMWPRVRMVSGSEAHFPIRRRKKRKTGKSNSNGADEFGLKCSKRSAMKYGTNRTMFACPQEPRWSLSYVRSIYCTEEMNETLKLQFSFMNLSLRFINMNLQRCVILLSNSNLQRFVNLQVFMNLERFMNLQRFMNTLKFINVQGNFSIFRDVWFSKYWIWAIPPVIDSHYLTTCRSWVQASHEPLPRNIANLPW